jgi:hypothetical protein
VLLTEGEALFADIENADLCSGENGKFNNGESDGSGSDDQDSLVTDELGTSDGVGTYCEGFDQGELVVGERWRGVQVASGNFNKFAHTTITMDAENLDTQTTIRFATLAGGTGATGKIGFDGATSTWSYVHTFTNCQNLDAEFVTENAGIAEERLVPLIGVEISATNTDAMYSDERLTGDRSLGLGQVDMAQVAWFIKDDCSHGKIPYSALTTNYTLLYNKLCNLAFVA